MLETHLDTFIIGTHSIILCITLGTFWENCPPIYYNNFYILVLYDKSRNQNRISFTTESDNIWKTSFKKELKINSVTTNNHSTLCVREIIR